MCRERPKIWWVLGTHKMMKGRNVRERNEEDKGKEEMMVAINMKRQKKNMKMMTNESKKKNKIKD
jgi:6,7-dimethyl-8-ribityllumazine synthase